MPPIRSTHRGDDPRQPVDAGAPLDARASDGRATEHDVHHGHPDQDVGRLRETGGGLLLVRFTPSDRTLLAEEEAARERAKLVSTKYEHHVPAALPGATLAPAAVETPCARAGLAGSKGGMVRLATMPSSTVRKQAADDPINEAEAFHRALVRWLADVAEGACRDK
jgi:hypothetical protein